MAIVGMEAAEDFKSKILKFPLFDLQIPDSEVAEKASINTCCFFLLFCLMVIGLNILPFTYVRSNIQFVDINETLNAKSLNHQQQKKPPHSHFTCSNACQTISKPICPM